MPPRELVLALRVSIDGLRPWEYWAMSHWDYERIAHAREHLHRARELFPPGWDRVDRNAGGRLTGPGPTGG